MLIEARDERVEIDTGCDCIRALEREMRERQRGREDVIVLSARRQGYRIKRLSACGGCLGDHRR